MHGASFKGRERAPQRVRFPRSRVEGQREREKRGREGAGQRERERARESESQEQGDEGVLVFSSRSPLLVSSSSWLSGSCSSASSDVKACVNMKPSRRSVSEDMPPFFPCMATEADRYFWQGPTIDNKHAVAMVLSQTNR